MTRLCMTMNMTMTIQIPAFLLLLSSSLTWTCLPLSIHALAVPGHGQRKQYAHPSTLLHVPVVASASRTSTRTRPRFRLYQTTADDDNDNDNNNNGAFPYEKSETADNRNDLSLSNTGPQTETSASASKPTISYKLPSYKAILLFVSTTILIWLSEPLLSLVDTTMVGRYGGGGGGDDAVLLQLAALGPATMLIDSLVYLTYFLSIATTSKMAKALAQRDYKSLQTTSSHIMGVAGILGFCVLALVFGMGRTLLTWSAGSSGSPQLIGAALEYSRIRCAVAPLSIVGMVAQSICLSVRDTTTPAVAVAVASIVNIVGDFCLVPRMGLTGAAIATAAASTSSTLVLLKSVRNKALDWRQKESEATGTNGLKAHVVVNGINATKVTTTVVDGKPVLYNDTVTTRNTTISGPTGTAVASDTTTTTRTSTLTSSQIPFISLPDRTSLLQLVQLAGPIFFVIVGKVVCYSAMTLKATNFGLSNVAAHNIMMRVFFFHATFGDSLTQAGQTFLPQTLLEKNNSKLKKLLKKLLVLATGIGVMNWISIQWVLHNCGGVFTSNLDIIRIMAANSSPMAMATFFHSYVMVFEGSIIAAGDFRYLVSTYAVTMAVLFAQLKFATPHFGGVWTALLVFQAMRLVQFKTRVFSKVLWRKSREDLTVDEV